MSVESFNGNTLSNRHRSSGSRISPVQHLAVLALPWLVLLWMFSGGFVLIEPSPYEAAFLLVLPVALIAGTGLYRRNLNLLNLLIVFLPSALIGAFQVTHMSVLKGIIYVVVTAFLWMTAFFAANFVADAPQKHMRLMMKGYSAAALLVAAIGILAYLRLLPGADLFLLYGRAKASFQDPNVFGPFLILPAMYALQRTLLGRGRMVAISGLVFGVLSIGVFVSFSRGAWGSLALAAILVFAACFLLEGNTRDRARMTVLALVGVGIGVAALLALLSIDSVGALFQERASVVQNYDSGTSGRFGRQAYAFELALAHPFGIGPLEFENLRITEEPHNTYVKVLLTYGWVGGLAFFALVWLTLKKSLGALCRRSPNRLLLIPLVATFIPLVLEAAIIDLDHWRHFFLVIGMIWGVTAGYDKLDQPAGTQRHGLI